MPPLERDTRELPFSAEFKISNAAVDVARADDLPPVHEEAPPTSSAKPHGGTGSDLGDAVVANAAGGAAGGLVSNLLDKIESFFKRDG